MNSSILPGQDDGAEELDGWDDEPALPPSSSGGGRGWLEGLGGRVAQNLSALGERAGDTKSSLLSFAERSSGWLSGIPPLPSLPSISLPFLNSFSVPPPKGVEAELERLITYLRELAVELVLSLPSPRPLSLLLLDNLCAARTLDHIAEDLCQLWGEMEGGGGGGEGEGEGEMETGGGWSAREQKECLLQLNCIRIGIARHSSKDLSAFIAVLFLINCVKKFGCAHRLCFGESFQSWKQKIEEIENAFLRSEDENEEIYRFSSSLPASGVELEPLQFCLKKDENKKEIFLKKTRETESFQSFEAEEESLGDNYSDQFFLISNLKVFEFSRKGAKFKSCQDLLIGVCAPLPSVCRGLDPSLENSAREELERDWRRKKHPIVLLNKTSAPLRVRLFCPSDLLQALPLSSCDFSLSGGGSLAVRPAHEVEGGAFKMLVFLESEMKKLQKKEMYGAQVARGETWELRWHSASRKGEGAEEEEE